ncbi:MAG: tRNA 2-thiouridine(34) synthase MnmA [Candidatus Brocadiia bacterium]
MKVAVAMSGGVDSSVAALLLLRAGNEVAGFTLRLFDGPKTDSAVADAAEVCRRIGIAHREIDHRKEFSEIVIGNFGRQYGFGRTPNPCVRCNEFIKFGLLRNATTAAGFEFLATGHYASIRLAEDGQWGLFRSRKAAKDQSYMLYRIDPTALHRTLFPLELLSKSEVRTASREVGLTVHERPESQDVCFIDGSYTDYLVAAGIVEEPGEIVDTSGRIVGRHTGVSRFTIGQRRNLGLPGGGIPFYVIAIEPSSRRVVVGVKADVFSTDFSIDDAKWLVDVAEGVPFECTVKVRYRTPGKVGTVTPLGQGASVRLHEPQDAIAPGQSAVFYAGDRVLGGGYIERVTPRRSSQ